METTTIETEKGAASLHIELKDGFITIYHGTDGIALHRCEVEEGTWERMFDSLVHIIYCSEI